MQYVTKITTKKIGIQPQRTNKPELGKKHMLATLIGIARDYKLGTSEYGEFAKFNGDFEAVRTSDGEVFRSARLILPPIFADSLRERLDADNGEGGSKSGVQFAVEIGVVGSDVAIGYEWTLAPIGKVSGSADPLAALRDEAAKALPPPTTEKAPTEKAHKAKK